MVMSGIWQKCEESEEFHSGLTVRHDKTIPSENVQEICASVGWSKREPLLIARALANSLAVVSVWNGPLIVGFARATGDKVFNATIWDVVVRPNYQHQGIGVLLMRELLQELDSYNIPLVTLYADPGTDNFYKRFGFLADPSGIRGMFREQQYI